MVFTNNVYDALKWIAQYLLPACGTLYFALSKIWGLPFGEEVVGTISAIDIFLGALLGISSMNYTGDGTLQIDTSDPEKDKYRLVYGNDLDTLAGKDTVTFKVDKDAKL